MLYVQYALPHNTLTGVSTTLAGLPSPGPNSGMVALSEFDEVPPAPYAWDALLLTFALPRRTALLTQLEFFDRFPEAVENMVHSLSPKDTPSGAGMRKLLARTAGARGINPEDPRVIAGVDQVLALAVALAVITSEQATAARPLILAPLNPAV